jgi:phosphoglycolate phosphatase-like HAD superfamily hydrolase
MSLLIFDFDGTICDSLDIFLTVGNDVLGTSFTNQQVRNIGTKELITKAGIS